MDYHKLDSNNILF